MSGRLLISVVEYWTSSGYFLYVSTYGTIGWITSLYSMIVRSGRWLTSSSLVLLYKLERVVRGISRKFGRRVRYRFLSMFNHIPQVVLFIDFTSRIDDALLALLIEIKCRNCRLNMKYDCDVESTRRRNIFCLRKIFLK